MVSYLLQHLVKVCLWHLLEQGILDLRHEHRIVLHFPAQLHVDTRLAVSFTVWFFWPHGDFKMKNNNKSVAPLNKLS
jgi:hypothetical protein